MFYLSYIHGDNILSEKKNTEIWILISITDDLYLFKFSTQFVFLIFNTLYTFIGLRTQLCLPSKDTCVFKQ